MTNLIENSKKLRQEAENVLKTLGLIENLKQYGEVAIVGSVYLDLMTWPDIDIEVITKSKPTRKQASEISKLLFSKPSIRRVTVVDETKSKGNKKPKGLYIGPQFVDDKGTIWKIDIWLLDTSITRSEKTTEEIKGKLTTEKREIILEIKSNLHDNPKYRKEITSMHIYDAVLNKNVENMDAFNNYLSELGIPNQ